MPPPERAALHAADRLSETIGFFYFKNPPRVVTSKPVGNAESLALHANTCYTTAGSNDGERLCNITLVFPLPFIYLFMCVVESVPRLFLCKILAVFFVCCRTPGHYKLQIVKINS